MNSLLALSLLLAPGAFAYPPILPPETIGPKVAPPICRLPYGLKPAPDMGPDIVRCGACPSGQGVKADGYCGQCAKTETVYGGRCCPQGASMTGGACVTEAEKKAAEAKAKARPACQAKCRERFSGLRNLYSLQACLKACD